MDELNEALELERLSRDASRREPGNGDLLREWLRAMGATNDASKRLRQATEE